MYIIIKYVVSFKDRIYINIKQKVNKFLNYALLWALALLFGIYMSFYEHGRIITVYKYWFGIILASVCTIAFIIYILWWVFHNYTLGLNGEVKWFINKPEESNEWKYKLNAVKKNHNYEESGTIKRIEENKKFIVIITNNDVEHIILKRKIKEEETKLLLRIKGELTNK